MADHSSDGLWHHDGVMMELAELPVSKELRRRIKKWCDWYEKSSDIRPVDFNYAKFALEGEAIAREIKMALPHWIVLYFDEAKALTAYLADQAIPREIFEYEIKAHDDEQDTESHSDQSVGG
jgi:hypothetical protein